MQGEGGETRYAKGKGGKIFPVKKKTFRVGKPACSKNRTRCCKRENSGSGGEPLCEGTKE